MNHYYKTGLLFCIIWICALFGNAQNSIYPDHTIISHGGIIRGDTTQKNIALVFTADEFGDGDAYILKALKNRKIRGSFFFTGNFYRNPEFTSTIRRLKKDGHYIGSHSDKHLLYCTWENRDSLLVTKEEFVQDLQNSYLEMENFGIKKSDAPFFLPPYEWYNDSISTWTKEAGLQLINFSSGTRSNADYTYSEMGSKYVSSDRIMESILKFENSQPNGLNGFILLIHFGTDSRRTDKFYHQLPSLLRQLKNKGYEFLKINELLPFN
ncbi:MAG: polysaccharide deacetylase family protein [Ginsengibacter sp.]